MLGFRRGKIPADMVVALHVLIEKTVEVDGHAVVVFIDYSEAFDCMHLSIIDVLNYIGHGRPISFPKHLVALREALYKDNSPVIRWDELCSSRTYIKD